MEPQGGQLDTVITKVQKSVLVAGTTLQANEKLELRQREEAGLPQGDRELVRKSRETVHAANETHQAGMQLLEGSINQLRIVRDSTTDPTIQAQLDSVLSQMIEGTEKVETAHITTNAEYYFRLDKNLDAGRETVRDEKTGAYTRTEMLKQFTHEFRDYLDGKLDPKDIVVKTLDFMNFKAGNDILGQDEFDLWLKENVTDRLIAVSIASGDTTYDPVAFETNIKEKVFGGKETLTPQQQRAREIMADLNEAGVKIAFFRAQAGGDEAFLKYHFTKGQTNELEKEANELIDLIMDMARLPKHKNKNDLGHIAAAAVGSWSTLSNLEGFSYDFDPDLYTFRKELNLYLDMTKKVHHQIETQEDCRIPMGFGSIRGDFNDVMINFFFGVNDFGNVKDQTESGFSPLLIYDADGNSSINPDAFKDYEERIKIKAKLYAARFSVNENGLNNFSVDTLAKDALGYWMQVTMGKWLEKAKKESKVNLMMKAYSTGDPSLLYQVGAMAQGKRLLDSVSYNDQRKMMIKIQANYMKRYEDEMAKPEESRDTELINFIDKYQQEFKDVLKTQARLKELDERI